MGEFVEQNLERLLPVFEQIQNVQLFDSKEVNRLVKQCRRYEYRLQKQEKTFDDFMVYVNFLQDALTLLRVRRNRNQYFHKHKFIEKPLKEKTASLLRRSLSKAYTKAIQLHPRDILLRCEAAEWELESNSSAENARTILQLAIRAYPADFRLYVSFFKVEIRFVDKILKRRKLLQEKKNEKKNKDADEDEAPQSSFDVDVEDAVLQLKICDAIVRQGLSAVDEEGRGKLLLEMWKDCSLFLHLSHASELLKSLEEKLNELDNEYTQLMEIEKAAREKKGIYDAYDEALTKLNTEKMLRLYLDFCAGKIKDGDMFAAHKKNGLICTLIEKGWASSADIPYVEDAIRNAENREEKSRLLEKILTIDQTSAALWTQYIECLMEKGDQEQNVLKTINKAIEAVPAESSFPLWELALDFTIGQKQPGNVDKLFYRIFDLGIHVDKFKAIRVKYLQALVDEKQLTKAEMRRMIRELQARRPNGIEFCRAVTESEVSEKDENVKLVKSTWEMAINEEGGQSAQMWIEYIKYLVRRHPEQISAIHQRAMLALENEHCDEFLEKWTAFQQNEAAKSMTLENS
ncbi:hypothetical protein WR25_06898 [Diploscapter pachys]|uniref:U3 small nucleolar RNA-associated protein 6 homolog n=1 Tax=Diploscapter pachys TaxID=2018661 RepID=A0A2A2L427_9BILA|nr:hypothetical protein WR25_06898 [Diploscapter pachys]